MYQRQRFIAAGCGGGGGGGAALFVVAAATVATASCVLLVHHRCGDPSEKARPSSTQGQKAVVVPLTPAPRRFAPYVSRCEEQQPQLSPHYQVVVAANDSTSRDKLPPPPPTSPSQIDPPPVVVATRWWWWWWQTLPAPPRRLVSHDPVWTLTASQLKQRARDEVKAQKLWQQISDHVVQQLQQKQEKAGHREITTTQQPQDGWEHRQKQVVAWQKEWMEIVHGQGLTMQDRHDFLEQYGCTGWTEEILNVLLKLATGGPTTTTNNSVGILEMGAGHGQWARVLTDRYNQQQQQQQQQQPHLSKHNKATKHFDFVLAYDNQSRLPLNPQIYHAKTLPAHQYFYDKVWPLRAHSVEATVKQWQCRGRLLLLVYPARTSSSSNDDQNKNGNVTDDDDDMALAALRAYDQVQGQTVVYVGEGRHGANASDAFFDYLENPENQWLLDQVMDVKSFGTKGYEKLYVLKKCPS